MHTTQQRSLFEPRTMLIVPLLAAVFAAGAALGTLADLDLTTTTGATSVPVGDRSYDAIEDIRADRGLSVPVGDRSYDAIEDIRADRGLD